MLCYPGSEWSHGLSDIRLVAFSTFDGVYDSFVITGEWSFVFWNDYIDLTESVVDCFAFPESGTEFTLS